MLLLLHRLAGRLRQSCAGVPSGARCRACRTRVRPRAEGFRCLLSVSTTKRPLSPGPSEREAFSRVEKRHRRLSGFGSEADGRSLRSRCDCQGSNPRRRTRNTGLRGDETPRELDFEKRPRRDLNHAREPAPAAQNLGLLQIPSSGRFVAHEGEHTLRGARRVVRNRKRPRRDLNPRHDRDRVV